jgi:hypothetical protein
MKRVHAFGPGEVGALCSPRLRATIRTWVTAKVTCVPCKRALRTDSPKRAAFEAGKQPTLPGLEGAARVTGRPRREPWAPNPNAAFSQERDDWCRECDAAFNAGHRACESCGMSFRPPPAEERAS